MVSVGLKALRARRHSTVDSGGDSLMGEEDKSYKQGKSRKGMARKARKGSIGFDGDSSNKDGCGRGNDGTMKTKKSLMLQSASEPLKPFVRKQIDPETSKYFSEISNLFESNEVDLEERSVICGNALEETRGKEFEIATDYIISHTMQTLLDGCDADHLCSFLQSSAKVFPAIATDRSGSHVAETALKSLARHLQDPEAYSAIEETLDEICKVIVANPVEMMCDCYGSHVLRRLLCLCKGVSLDSFELHGAKSSAVLAERLNLEASRFNGNDSLLHHQGFPDLFKFLLSGILKCSREDIKTLQVDQYSSLVLQTALRLLVEHVDELLHIIPMILGCNEENVIEGNRIEMDAAGDIVELMKETAFSHLMEVILEVAPESLYNEMFNKVFKNWLFELSLDRCGNFVVQALVSHAKDQEQMGLIWERLGPKFRDFLEQGKSGVIASLIAASQRLNSHEHKCCEALAAAVCSDNDSPNCIIPRLLFLDNFFGCEDKSNWKWASGAKMHIMGSLILQEIFKFRSELIQPYVTSITSMEAEHIFEAAKDARGARVLEAFLVSNAPTKQKRRLVMKLRGHFGELGLQSSGSFTVEKCFNASNLSLREAIASELLAVRSELSKTKQGPYLLRRLDIDGFAAKPDQWRSRQEAKQSAYKEFCTTFGSTESNLSKKNAFLSDTTTKQASQAKDLKDMRKEIDHHLTTGTKRPREEHAVADKNTAETKKKLKNRKNGTGAGEAMDRATSKRPFLSSERPFLSSESTGKKRHGKGGPSKASKKWGV